MLLMMMMETQLPNPWYTPLVTVREAGRLLGLSRAATYRAVAEGDLPTISLGGTKVRTADLYEHLGLPMPPRPGPPPAT